MEPSILAFGDCLRRNGVRVSTAELVDATVCAAQPGMLRTRSRLHAALRAALVTRESSLATFDSVFALFFALRPVQDSRAGGTEDASELALDGTGDESGTYDEMSLVDGTANTSQINHGSSAEMDTREFFDPDSLKRGKNLDDDADIADLAAMSDEVSFSPSGAKGRAGMKVQLDVNRSKGADSPGALSPASGQSAEVDLSADEEERLLTWLGASGAMSEPDPDQSDELRGILERLPEHLAEHLRHLAALRHTTPTDVAEPVVLDDVSERERDLLEDAIRRITHSLEGGLSQKVAPHARGRVAGARTARRSMRYDGVPFKPVTVARVRERARVLVLADVSLSVRATARFTLHVVHGLQSSLGYVRTFAFVDDLTEVTRVFERHPLEHALGLVFGGDLLDTEASSDYGSVFEQLLTEHGDALDRRTSLMILGDGRSNGRDPAVDAFAEITRRLRTTVWLTPESTRTWKLGACAMPDYAPLCDRVEVVRDLDALQRTSRSISEAR